MGRAEGLAKQPFVDPAQPAGNSPHKLTYDQYRAIRFQKGASIWAHQDRTFTLDLFHPGFIYDTPVNINVVTDMARRVFFDNEKFDYGPEVPVPNSGEATGYSGFRVRAPINRPDYPDEFLMFQGASYFRGVARDQNYGISARGLAVRTARPEGEEFPVFTDFWIERPAVHATALVIHALLQSRSVVGAYTFNVTMPGEETVIDVDAALFPRTELTAYGIAPLTSMFLFDASARSRFDDFRNAVHDSDGLQIVTGRGERVWRPLANPRTLQVSAFLDDSPRGFGLLQRKRAFADYEDWDSRYERRPSLWVEPRGGWGPGHVELVEIPSDREIHDNIVAYWQPATPLPAGKPAEFSYRLRYTTEPLDTSLARVVGTRSGGSINSADQRAFVVDFQGPTPPPDDVQITVTTSTGQILDTRGSLVTATGAYRVSFELAPERADVVELRALLTSKEQPWSETWLYRWSR